MFDSLSDRLQGVLGGLRNRGILTEEDLDKALREIRLALLEADVNFKVVKEFLARVKARALGADVLKSLTPGQQVVKVVNEELSALMGQGSSKLAFSGRPPTVILLCGLQGSGKTTATAKLALFLRKKEGKNPAVAACDLQRPAAIEQLAELGRQIQVPVYLDRDSKDPVAVATSALEQARAQGRDTLIVDTAGRLHVDEELMDELVRVRNAVKPHNVLLVLDSMTGQDAVNVAEAFAERVAFDGVILTKLDGDARGGAALSVKAVTGKPIKFASTGEKVHELDYFHPDRIASRILGMGDVLTLIERAEEAAEVDEQAELERRMRAGVFTFDDFLKSYDMMKKMGPLTSVLSMVPGMRKQMQGMSVDDKALEWARAIVLSMTPEERRRPDLINGQRRARIARGSGTTVQQVNQLLNGRKQMEKMIKQMGKGKMPNLQSMVGQMRR